MPSDNTTDNVTDDNNTIKIYLSAADNIAVGATTWYNRIIVLNLLQLTQIGRLSSSGTRHSVTTSLTMTFDNSLLSNNTTVAIYVWVMDNAGNISSAVQAMIHHLLLHTVRKLFLMTSKAPASWRQVNLPFNPSTETNLS